MWFEGVSDRGWIRVLTLVGRFRVFYARVVEVVKELTQDGVILFFSELPCKPAVWDVVQVLQPFEIGNSDTTSVQIQIWNDQAFVGNQDLVTSWSDWTIGTFGDDLGLDLVCVIGSDDLEKYWCPVSNEIVYLFLSTGSKNVAFDFNESSIFLAIPCFGTWETNDCTVGNFVVFQCLDVNTVSIVNISIPFSNTNTFGALIISYITFTRIIYLTILEKYLAEWKPTLPKPCIT